MLARPFSAGWLIVLWGCSLVMGAAAPQPVAMFTVKEAFGVAHPDQIIDFDCGKTFDPQSHRMIGPNGQEVAYQVLRGGRIAVRTDLPAGATKTWQLVPGRPAKFDGVKISGDEITNGLTGFRTLIGDSSAGAKRVPAPVQGILLRDGKWTATGPNLIEAEVIAVRGISGKVVESGPLKVVVEVIYAFDKPEYQYGQTLITPGGPGMYRCLIELQAGQPSILFEEETDANISWSVDFFPEVRPDQARYRGHSASDVKFGREPDGRAYRAGHERPQMDAAVDLTYDRPRPSSYNTRDDAWRRLTAWDPWARDGGWYWQFYDRSAGPAGNLVGIFAGRASRALGAGVTGPGLYTLPADEKNRSPRAGVTMNSGRRGPDASVYPKSRMCWGLFIGTKADLADAKEVQPINRQMNLHGGINLNKLHRLQFDFADPPQGYGAAYMDKPALQRIIQRVRDDREYYRYRYNAASDQRDLIDLWADASGQRARKTADSIAAFCTNALDAHVNGNGIYSFHHAYWHLGLEVMRRGLLIDAMLGGDALDEPRRAAVKSAAVLFASILFDDDFVPLFDGHNLNLGTANMPVQYAGYRRFYALLLAGHPMMKDRAAAVQEQALATARRIINEHGAEMGCPHYMGASVAPTLNTLLQVRMLGPTDPFKTEPRLAKFAEFYMQLHTPPEVRFGGERKLVCFGDGATERTELTGVLATGFRAADPERSARLMGLWNAGGKAHSGFFGPSLLMIDDQAPAKDPALADGHFEGWCSVLRHGWGTPEESALWLLNGDFHSDHRHDDRGSVALYALGAPLSLDWGAMYVPRAPGSYMQSAVVPEDFIGHAWDRNGAAVQNPRAWRESSSGTFVSLPSSALAQAICKSDGSQWSRTVYALRGDLQRPVYAVFDTATSPRPHVLSWTMMAQGPVGTSAGAITPPEPADGGENGSKLPSASAPFDLQPGITRFAFTGQWMIDWDVYVLGRQPKQALLGQWAHRWAPGSEAGQFKRANGRDFEERQHLLRVRSEGPFVTLIVPWRKGQKLEGLSVAEDGRAIVISGKDWAARLDAEAYTFAAGQRRGVAALGMSPAQSGDLRVEGGPAEITLDGATATLAAHGAPGERRFRLPGEWKAAGPLKQAGGQFTLDYAGGEPVRVVLEKAP